MSDGESETYKACADKGPQNFHCTRHKGHDGPHRAISIDVEWSK